MQHCATIYLRNDPLVCSTRSLTTPGMYGVMGMFYSLGFLVYGLLGLTAPAQKHEWPHRAATIGEFWGRCVPLGVRACVTVCVR